MKMREPKSYRDWYDKSQKPDPNFYIQPQHIHILELILEYELLADYQLMGILGIRKSRLHELMGQLWNNHYVNRPNRRLRAAHDYMFWMLKKKGAKLLAKQQSSELRDLIWVRKPKPAQIEHDVSINDFRIVLELAMEQEEEFEFIDWESESVFRSRRDRVEYLNAKGLPTSREYIADGYVYFKRQREEKNPFYGRFLVEVELSPKPNRRFADQKILAGLAYIKSDHYFRNFGARGGRILYVVPNQEKMENYLGAADRVLKQNDRRWFYFALREDITVGKVLFDPIWWRPGDQEPMGLMIDDPYKR